MTEVFTKALPAANVGNSDKYNNSNNNSNGLSEKSGIPLAGILKNSISCPEQCAEKKLAINDKSRQMDLQSEEFGLLRPPVTTSADCSLPLAKWTGLAQQTGTRPAVDSFTVSRYSPAEWYLHNDSITKESKEAIRNARNIVFNAGLIDGQVYTPIDKNQTENHIRLKDRAHTVFHWKVELERNNTEITAEIESILGITQRLMRCSRAVELIKTIDGDIKKIRNMRLESDLVHDSLTDELIKEETLCSEIINLYNRFMDEVKMQIKELKDAKRRLEHDWAGKQDAYDIDTACLGLKVTSPTLQWKPGCVQLQDGQSTPAGHDYFVKESIALAQASITRSRILSASVKDMITQAVKDLKSQSISVEMALADRLNATNRACRELERTLDQCLKSLSNTETVFEKISNAVRKLDAPMKCTQTRLNMRAERKDVEQCRDTPQFGLIDEVKDISNSVSTLTSQIKNAEYAMEALTKSREKIEKEIIIKKKTLWVDGERCPLMRSLYPTTQSLSGYN